MRAPFVITEAVRFRLWLILRNSAGEKDQNEAHNCNLLSLK